MPDLDLQLVAEGLRFPEGPVAMADGSVIVTEIAAGRLTRIQPDGRKETVVETGGSPNGLAVGPDGAFYVCDNGGRFGYVDMDGLTIPEELTPPHHVGGSIQRIDPATRVIETLYEDCEGERLLAPNDLVFERGGGFWFTDNGTSRVEARGYGALYWAKPDGSKIVQARHRLFTPNGVGLSPDETVVYMADTMAGRVWAFDIVGEGKVAAGGLGAPGRLVVTLPGYQLLDSLAVEADGRVCVATILNGGITAVTPTGEVEHFPVPDIVTTNIAFGGPDMRDAWITASATGRLYRCRWPRPGLKLAFNA